MELCVSIVESTERTPFGCWRGESADGEWLSLFISGSVILSGRLAFPVTCAAFLFREILSLSGESPNPEIFTQYLRSRIVAGMGILLSKQYDRTNYNQHSRADNREEMTRKRLKRKREQNDDLGALPSNKKKRQGGAHPSVVAKQAQIPGPDVLNSKKHRMESHSDIKRGKIAPPARTKRRKMRYAIGGLQTHIKHVDS